MIIASLKDGRVVQIWRGVPAGWRPSAHMGEELIELPDGADVRPFSRWDGQQLLPPEPPALPDEKIIAAAQARIDEIVDQVFTTSASRAARYEAKYQEALRYRDAGYPGSVSAADYPYLTAEASARGMTKRQLADAIIAAADAYRQFGALAEAKRAELKTAIPAATDAAAKQAAAEAIVAEVVQAAQALKG